jgi:hypothetical protein
VIESERVGGITASSHPNEAALAFVHNRFAWTCTNFFQVKGLGELVVCMRFQELHAFENLM